MDVATYWFFKSQVARSPYANDIEWAESIEPPSDALDFFIEYGWVVINSGIKNQVAQKIWERVKEAIRQGRPVREAFRHPGKSAAIQAAWDKRETLFDAYCVATDKLQFCANLAWIGPITKYHLAKNFGIECVKPDRHLVRIASASNETPEQMCRRIADATGDRLVVVDTVIWRAANMGLA